MGSEGPKEDHVGKTSLGAGFTIGSCTILETAGDGALPMLRKVLESSVSATNEGKNQQVVWLHLGVNSGATQFAIERLAVNEATFRCPDELGWQPLQHPIVSKDGGTSFTRETCCSMEAILKILQKMGHDVTSSDDAGRFVCNYVYYHSLKFAEEKGHKSLFVHVPLFTTVERDTQMSFVVALLEAIASTC
ncbi:Peptidase C15 pyroglutamyl peptidase I-like [Euphorbia peplus]|nr:Peptidase C15 pyroglutamyl peptidase I-like [Euphorbia peplus]